MFKYHKFSMHNYWTKKRFVHLQLFVFKFGCHFILKGHNNFNSWYVRYCIQ